MYYQEKVINGILHFKLSPDGEWKPLSVEQLTHTIVMQRQKYDQLLNKMCAIQDAYTNLIENNELIKAIKDSF